MVFVSGNEVSSSVAQQRCSNQVRARAFYGYHTDFYYFTTLKNSYTRYIQGMSMHAYAAELAFIYFVTLRWHSVTCGASPHEII
jgi:hypothetical protein